jgi:HSP20 family protein
MTARGEDLPTLMRRFFSDDMVSDMLTQPATWLPPVEVIESDKEIVITAELPGLVEKDIEISFDDDIITISGEKTEEKKEGDEDKRYHVFERTYGAFRRSFTLPSNVDPNRVVAEFKAGILTIRVPKAESDKNKKRKIPISAGK